MSAAPTTISAPAVTYSAPPVLLEEQSNVSVKDEEKPVAATGWAKKPTSGPPPMSLPDGEEDINGFQKTAAGKKAAKKVSVALGSDWIMSDCFPSSLARRKRTDRKRILRETSMLIMIQLSPMTMFARWCHTCQKLTD